MPLDTEVELRAVPVYPELARFTFAGEKQIVVPDDLLAYATLVTTTLAASPRLYAFRTGPSSLANIRSLFGPKPADEPDPWQRVVLDGDGNLSLVASLPGEAVQALLEQEPGPGSDSVAWMKQAADQEPDIAGVQAMLADASLAAGDIAMAEAGARAALAMDPFYPHALRVLAEVALRKNDKVRAGQFVARALALYPTYARAWKIAEMVVGRPIERAAVVEQPFIAVNDEGAVVVVTCDRPFCSGYAACKAAFRYEPVFRASVLQESADVPYHLSATEEVVCLQAGLGAHVEARVSNPQAAHDPTAELLIQLASEKGLTAFALFEVLGTYRPEWMRVAPRAIHTAIVQHVHLRVLGTPSGSLRPLPDKDAGTADTRLFRTGQ